MLARGPTSREGANRTVFKLLKYLVILVVVVVILAIGGLYFSLNYLVKSVVVNQGTAQLGVPTTLGSATLGLTGGSVGLKDFAVGSPQGFTAPQMLSVGNLKVDTAGLTHLMDKPLHVTDIQVDAPKLVIEQKGLTLNFKELLDHLPGKTATGESKPSSTPGTSNPTKLVIDTLAINNATVEIIPDAGGAASGALGALGDVGKLAAKQADKQLDKAGIKPVTVTLPSLEVKNIGNTDGKMEGAEVKDVAAAIIQAMAASAAKSANLPIDPALLSGNLDSIKDKAGDEVQKQLKKLPGGAGDAIKGLLGGKK